MKKFALIALSLAIALPASAQTLKLDSEDKPCLKNFSIQKGTVYQINAYEYDYLQLSDNKSFRIKNAQGKALTPRYEKAVKAYIVEPLTTGDQGTVSLTATKTGKVNVCLYNTL